MLADSVNNSTKLKSDRFRSMWNGKIKGQRYFDTIFKKGKINNEDFLIRYDLYEDRFEFKKNIRDKINYVKRDLSFVISYDSSKFYFLPYYYKNKRKFNVGYLNLLVDNDSLKIYTKIEVTFRPATFSPTTIEIGFPPRFIKRQLYFTQQREKTPIQISKRKIKNLGFYPVLYY